MQGRDSEFLTVTGLIESGLSVDLLGNRSSGRTLFLTRLRERLQGSGWTVIVVRGVSALREHPYAALHAAGIRSSSADRRQSTLELTVSALRMRLEGPRAVLLVDDWDDLDETSIGVVETVTREVGMPLVRARQRRANRGGGPGRTGGGSSESAFAVSLDPLPFDTLRRMLEDRVEGPIDLSTMSLLHEKSGGNPGLALSVVDAAIRGGRMERAADGFWVATRGVWSDSLVGIVEAQLVGLSTEARDAIEIVARVGVAELQTVRRLVSWDALEDLEGRGLIRLRNGGGGQLVTVTPLLVVDLFRHDQQSIRRARLAEFVAARLADDSSELRFLSDDLDASTPEREDDGTLRRHLEDRIHTRRIVARTEWERERGTASAVRYLEALIGSGADTDEVGRVLASTDHDRGDVADRVAFTLIEARWLAAVQHKLDRALDMLEERIPAVGRHAALLEAERVALAAHLRAIPDDWEKRLAVEEDLPADVLAGVLETRLLIEVALCRSREALETFERLTAGGAREASALARLYCAIAEVGLGEHAEAEIIMRRGYDEAIDALDIEAIRVFGAGLTMLMLLAGDHRGLDRVLQTVLGLGDVPPIPVGIGGTILVNAATVAFRRGDDALGSRRLAGADKAAPAGPLLSVSAGLPRALALTNAGRETEAADGLWEDGLELWRRGARSSALFSLLGSVEIAPDRERLTSLSEHLSQVDAPLLAANVVYLRALAAEDPDAIMAAVDRLLDTARYALAMSALRAAATLYREQGRPEPAEEATQREEDLIRELQPRVVETSRFVGKAVNLSDREREVARLAATGRSNQQIAGDLVVSVRTVESHMYHVLRKLGLPSRQALRRYEDRL